MSTVMTLIIAVIVIIIVAGSVLLIFRGQVVQGILGFTQKADVKQCLDNRDFFCQDNLNGCWDSSQATAQGTSCDNALNESGNLGADNIYYHCQSGSFQNHTDNCNDNTGIAG